MKDPFIFKKRRDRMKMEELQTTLVGNYSSVNGLKIHYEVQGSGRPRILLNGASGKGTYHARVSCFGIDA